MDSLFFDDDLEFIKRGDDEIVSTPRDIFAPKNKRGSSVKTDLYRYLYAFLLLHPEQKKDEFGDVLFFFVTDYMMRKAMKKRHFAWEMYEEIKKEENEKLLQWAQAHRNEVDAWGECLSWLKGLLAAHKSFIEFD